MENNKLQFYLGNSLKVIDFDNDEYLPSTSVLNFLRNEGLTGTKEGCGEGDCGACTVVTGTLESGKMVYHAVNSCLVFLASLHGKQLITVEHLAKKRNDDTYLHPVQQAMVENHASQCGFCTPGIVMNLFAQYKSAAPAEINALKLSLAGNLCRCTGYDSILKAAVVSLQHPVKDRFNQNESEVFAVLAQILKSNGLHIVSKRQKYFLPFSLKEALQRRSQYPAAKIINGNTDNAIRQNKTFVYDTEILDLSAIEEISRIYETNGEIHLGASCTIERLRLYVKDRIPAFSTLLDHFASSQIRNVATVGGNVCNASPIGDLLPAFVALRAKVEIKSILSSRIIPLEHFIVGYRSIDLSDNELLTEIILPPLAHDIKFFSIKASVRKQVDISTVSLSMSLQLDDNMIVTNIALVYGGMATTVKRACTAENFLVGKQWTKDVVLDCIPLIDNDFVPISDARANAETRRRLAENLFMKLFYQSAKGESHE